MLPRSSERAQLAREYEANRASAAALLARPVGLGAPSSQLLARPQLLQVSQTLAGTARSELLRLACRIESTAR